MVRAFKKMSPKINYIVFLSIIIRNIILRHCDSSNWIVLIIKQANSLLTDKIILNATLKVSCGKFVQTYRDLSWKLTRSFFEAKIINSTLLPFNEKNAKNKSLILEIEVIQMQITSICNLLINFSSATFVIK